MRCLGAIIMNNEISLFTLLNISEQERPSYSIRLNGILDHFDPLEIYYSDYEKLLDHISRRLWVKERKRGIIPYSIAQKKVLQFIQGSRDDSTHWLFIGAFDVLGFYPDSIGEIYTLKRIEKFHPFEARLLVEYKRKPGRTGHSAVNYDLSKKELLVDFESRMFVTKISQSPISSLPFPGYENVRLNYRQLVAAVNNSEWQAALNSVQGIYLQTDTSNGWHYIGSAYSEKGESKGILSRWKEYSEGDHSGGNKLLKKLVNKEHIEQYFQYSILEIFDMNKNKNEIINREHWWMETLSSVRKIDDHLPHGYNSL